MGEKSEFIIHTGSPSIDEIVKKKITKKGKLEEKYRIKIRGDEILLLQHPVTTETDETEMQISQTLGAIIKLKKKTIIIGSNLDPGNKIIYKKIIKVAEKYDFIEFYTGMYLKWNEHEKNNVLKNFYFHFTLKLWN